MKYLFNILTFAILAFSIFTACKKEPPADVTAADSTYTITNIASWNIASVPLRFAESNLNNNVASGFNRAKIAWYTIDPTVFYDKSSGLRPPNIKFNDMSNDDCRVIYNTEFFQSEPNPYYAPINMNTFNLDYYPDERGPMNFDTIPSIYSAGIRISGKLKEPTTRWAGIIRKIYVEDIETLNSLDFWLLDPFTTYPDADGELVFDIGEISEDVMKDGLCSTESTVAGNTQTSVWGLIKPHSDYYSFPPDNDRKKYDTGLDELQNDGEHYYSEDEHSYFGNYLKSISSICDQTGISTISKDPSADDFHSFLGDDYDQFNYKIRERYKNWNGTENNSLTNDANSPNSIGQRNPNTEDINQNLILDTLNNYHEYKVVFKKQAFVVGTNYLVEKITNLDPTQLENMSRTYATFYHFRIPLSNYTATYGNPTQSSNPKYIRLYLTGFSSQVNMRFVQLYFTKK